MGFFLTPAIVKEAMEIMQKYHGAAAAAMYGKNAVTPEEWDLAIALGFVDPKTSKATIASQLSMFGSFLAHLDHSAQYSRYGNTASDWLNEIKRNPIPMTKIERMTADYANARSARFVTGLGNRVEAATGKILINADKALEREMRSTIKDVVAAKFGDDDAAKRMKDRGVALGLDDDFFDNAFRQTREQMRSDLGQATKDWTRDWTRIVQTEAQEALNEGLRAGWESEEEEKAKEDKRPPFPVLCYKLPKPDACNHCVAHHLEGGRGGSPRIFTLDDLTGNGTNVGKKRGDWQPGIGPLHPYCACALIRLPNYIEMPKGWSSGKAAPSIVGPGGVLFPDEDEGAA